MTAPVARLRGVTHWYGDLLALDGVTLDIPAGCMAGFIGPDGAGKSTLLALVAGAKREQAGTIEVLGGNMGRTWFCSPYSQVMNSICTAPPRYQLPCS